MLNPQVESTNFKIKDATTKDFDIGVFLVLLFKSKWLIGSYFIIVFSVVFFYLRYSQTIYESKSVLQLDEGDAMSDVIQQTKLNTADNILAKTTEQIRSRQFLKRVVDKLDIGITYHSEGTFKSNELYLANPYRVLIHVKDPRVYQCKCYISFNESLSQCKLSCPDFECNIVPGQWTRNRYMDIQVFFPANVNLQELKSFFKNAPRLYFKVTESEIMAGLIQSRLEIKPLNAQAKTLQLKYRDINAQKSSDVVNTISAEYLIYDVDRKSESSKNILSFQNGKYLINDN
ncbi:MAG: Wzz/FepE/Etk N-terminal domain-containing protein, partial [Bacteroidia bacterium]